MVCAFRRVTKQSRMRKGLKEGGKKQVNQSLLTIPCPENVHHGIVLQVKNKQEQFKMP